MARYTDGIITQELRLSLDRYQEIMRLAPAAFNGLHKDDEEACFACAPIWKQYDLDALAIVIGQAEEMREQELGYHLAPVYVLDEEHDFTFPTILNKKHLVEIGIPATSDIQLGYALTLRDMGGNIIDPVIISVATTVTETDEICLYYPGEDVKLHPTKITISGGIATIEIPRSRLVDPDTDINCDPPPEYDDDTNFLRTVDIKRCYNDPRGSYIVWFGECSAGCIPSAFNETLQDAYARITNNRLSIIELYPASYSGGTYSPSTYSKCCSPCISRVSYKSGRQSSISTEILTARLAHTLLSELLPAAVDPCSECYKDDRMVDTENPLMTPYGAAQGAIRAWMADSRAKVGQGGKFPRVR